MPHFAMRGAQDAGMAGAIRRLAHHLFGGRDLACIQAGTELAMSRKQCARRHVDLAQVKDTAARLGCEITKKRWLAPSGPATHLEPWPPGHGTPPPGYGVN